MQNASRSLHGKTGLGSVPAGGIWWGRCFCAHGCCAEPVTLVGAFMSASSLDVSIGLPGFLFVLLSRVRNPRAGHPPAMGRVTCLPICWRGKRNG